MKTSFKKYGEFFGKDLCELVLENDHNMKVKLLNYGACLEKVIMPDGQNMVMSLEKPSDYHQERNFLGACVGRICGRVKNGQWQHGNQILQLPRNDGDNEIHGGKGTDTKVWNFKLASDEKMARADFYFFDPDGNNGFPGNLKIHVSYYLDNSGRLFYQMDAQSDKLTIFNPANHTYFTLGQMAEDLKLELNADYYLPVAQDGLPIDGMKEVDGSAFDFRKPKLISDALTSEDEQIKLRNGIDHPFILNGNAVSAILTSKEHQMVMRTDAPAIVVYTANHFNHTGIAKNIGQYQGVTLEAQVAPSSNSNLDAITLLPNEKYSRHICWAFS